MANLSPSSSLILDKAKTRVKNLFHGGTPETEAKIEVESTIGIRRSMYDTRAVALNQLENFYLPFMKEVYSRASDKLAGNIKPPDEILQLLRQGEGRLSTDHSRRQIQMKDNRIGELLSKIQQLYDQLKQFKPESEIKFEMPRQLQDYEKKIKRLENLLRIKNEEMFFSFKVKATNLLEEFQTERKDIEGIQQLSNENEVFEFMVSKLKLRLKDMKSRQKSESQVHQKEKMEVTQYEENLRYMTETNDLLKNNERRARQKVQQIKKQWKNACDRIVASEKLNQQKDNEIFRMKKLLEEKDNHLLKIPNIEKSHSSAADQMRKQHETQLKDMRALLNNYNLEINQLKTTIESKDEYIEQMMIRQNFLQEEFERANRQHVRWKQRYEGFEQQSDIKRVALEAQYNQLLERVGKTSIQLGETSELEQHNKQLQTNLAMIQAEKLQLQERLKIMEPEIKQMEESFARMDSHNKQLQSALASMHKEKMDSTERIKQIETQKNFIEQNNRDLQLTITGLHKEKSEKQKSLEQSLLQMDQQNKELQSTLALKQKEKSDLSEKLAVAQQQLTNKKTQIDSNTAGLQSKYKSQLSHEQTLREALILQAVSVKEVEHMEKIRSLTQMHNRRIASMEHSFQKKMKTWQNSHDDKFLQELARVTEQNAILKQKLAEKEKSSGSNANSSTIVHSITSLNSANSMNSNQDLTPPIGSRKIEVIRTKDLKR